jgi:phospholipase A-2-activating protein
MVTASADKLIKLWKAGVSPHTLSGHTDAVRSLAVISSSEFLSAGNDASVCRWSTTGDCPGTYYGDDNYIYCISLLGVGGWVTSGEDMSVRVWRDNAVVQTIYLPALSVWSIAALANGDIA